MGLERNVVIIDLHPLHSDFTRMITDKRSATRRCSARALELEGKTNLVWELAGDAQGVIF